MDYQSISLILLFGAMAITLIASLGVKINFAKYNKVRSLSGITAEEAAARIMYAAGIDDVTIEHISGKLTDHYSPNEKVLRLSDSVMGSTSIASISVAAHECGHAIQHKEGYGPLKLRSVSVPVANIGSKLSWPIIVIGLVLEKLNIAYIGVFLFLFVIAFQLITLPVEFNASSRALRILEGSGIFTVDEMPAAQKVLKAAAMTYVAALASSIMQLLRMLLILNGGSSKKRGR